MTHWIGLGILMTFQIERPRPNEEGHVNHILVRIWLIHQASLRFPISPLLKEVMAWRRLTFMQVSVNFVRVVLAIDTLMQRENLPFNASGLIYVYCPRREPPHTNLYTSNHFPLLPKPQQPHTKLLTEVPNKDMYLNDFVWVSGSWEFWAGDDGLYSFPRNNGSLRDSKLVFNLGCIYCTCINLLCCLSNHSTSVDTFQYSTTCSQKGLSSALRRFRESTTMANPGMWTFLSYKPIYCHVIPYRAKQLKQIRLPSLRIREWAPRRR